MKTRGRDNRSVVAFVAAALLLVQAFLSGWAGAAMAGQPMFDAFGNPLCISDSVDTSAAPSGKHDKMPTCCEFGCASVAPNWAEPASVIVAGPRAEISAARMAPPRRVSAIIAPDHDPASPRAPPLHG